VAPANVSEGSLPAPGLHDYKRRWSWWPRRVVADRGYLTSESKRLCRQRWRVAVVTHLRLDIMHETDFANEYVCNRLPDLS